MVLLTAGVTFAFPQYLTGSASWACSDGRAIWTLQREPADAVDRGRAADHGVVETSIPFRLDALYWSGFHTRVVLALGITWVLDGLEVTLAGALSGALKQSPVLHFSNFEVGFANSCYLAGAVLGAFGFGWLTDRIGRKKLFFITLGALSRLPPPPRRCRGVLRVMRCFVS